MLVKEKILEEFNGVSEHPDSVNDPRCLKLREVNEVEAPRARADCDQLGQRAAGHRARLVESVHKANEECSSKCVLGDLVDY